MEKRDQVDLIDFSGPRKIHEFDECLEGTINDIGRSFKQANEDPNSLLNMRKNALKGSDRRLRKNSRSLFSTVMTEVKWEMQLRSYFPPSI